MAAVAVRHLSGVEGVRALAASSIVIYHCWLYGGPGEGPVPLGVLSTYLMPHLALGVTLFFTLSGFLLYLPFVSAMLEGRRLPSVRTYLGNRALRIVPAYWVILAIVALVLDAAILPNTAPGLRIGTLAGQPLLVVLAASSVQSYAPTTLFLGIGPAWSLSVEAVFYLALPVLAWIGWSLASVRDDPRWRLVSALVPPLLLFALGLSGKVMAAFVAPGTPVGGGGVSWRDVLTFSFWAQADLFSAGMTLAILYAALVGAGTGVGRSPRLVIALGALCIAVVAASLRGGEGLSGYAYQTLMSVALACLLALVVLPVQAGGGQPLLVRGLSQPWLLGLGLVSYSLFLWHEPIVHLLARRGLTATSLSGLLVEIAVVGTVAIALSIVTYRLVERPALRHKRQPQPAQGQARDVTLARDQADAAP
jgi:peptidoglycan/LPS O-acetylase OafA/YrhL